LSGGDTSTGTGSGFMHDKDLAGNVVVTCN